MWDPIRLTKVIQYTVYVKLYKNSWIGNVLADDFVQAVYKT